MDHVIESIIHMLALSHRQDRLELREMIGMLTGGKSKKSFSTAGFEVKSQFSAKALIEG